MSAAAELPAPGRLRHFYSVAGVPCSVTATPDVLEVLDDTYGAYRARAGLQEAFAFVLESVDDGFALTDSESPATSCRDEREAAFLAVEQIARHVTGELAKRGIYATHAAALVHRGEAVLISGRSGAGKTTLALGLAARGLGILSDEFALSAPDGRTILPYRRGFHIRPGTPELIEPLQHLANRPFHRLSGGRQWTLRPEELERILPGCLAEASPLRHVVLLGQRSNEPRSVLEPVSAGIAAVELTGSTTAAATDFGSALKRMTELTAGARCVRLRAGNLESSLDVLLDWLSDSDGKARS